MQSRSGRATSQRTQAQAPAGTAARSAISAGKTWSLAEPSQAGRGLTSATAAARLAVVAAPVSAQPALPPPPSADSPGQPVLSPAGRPWRRSAHDRETASVLVVLAHNRALHSCSRRQGRPLDKSTPARTARTSLSGSCVQVMHCAGRLRLEQQCRVRQSLLGLGLLANLTERRRLRVKTLRGHSRCSAVTLARRRRHARRHCPGIGQYLSRRENRLSLHAYAAFKEGTDDKGDVADCGPNRTTS